MVVTQWVSGIDEFVCGVNSVMTAGEPHIIYIIVVTSWCLKRLVSRVTSSVGW